MTTQLSPTPVFKAFNNDGEPLTGGFLYSYVAGTTTPQATWTDSTQNTPNTNPIVLNARGECALWLDPTLSYKFLLTDSLGNTIPGYPVDNIIGYLQLALITQSFLGSILFPQTTAESTASVTPLNLFYQGLEVIDVLRYGIIPNDSSSTTAGNNSTRLTALGNAKVTGPKGTIIFPNTTGTDIYYFSGIAHQFRPGLSIDLCGSTLNFAKSYSAGTDDTHGFIEAIANFECKNGKINVSYVGGGVNNAGPTFRLGSRSGYAFGNYPNGIFDADDNVFMGLIKLSNLSVITNCTSAPAIWMIGGIDGLVFENLAIDGGLGQGYGIAYEFGYSSTNGQPNTTSAWSSSHARNMSFRNIRITNLLTSATGEAGIDLGGAYDCVVDGLSVDTAYIALQFRAGEALYYRPWSRDATGVKPAHMVARNITAQNIANTAIALQGSEPAGSSYLSAVITALGHPGDYIAQTDLIHHSLDSFAVSGTGTGVSLSGPGTISNGVVSASSNGIVITDECCWFDINNVRILNSTGIGIRGTFGGAVWAPARLKMGKIRNSKVCGSVATSGITMSNSQAVEILDCQIGFSFIYDSANESTQTIGVNVDATTGGGGVYCRGCFVTTSGGANAYSISGTLCNPCGIYDPKGLMTTSGPWDINGSAYYNATQIADKTSFINNNNTALTAITFTAPPTGTSGTLTGNWTSPSGTYPLLFQDAELRYAVFTNASASVTWTGALTGAPTAAGNQVSLLGTNKYIGRRCYDTTNTRIMIAQGSTNTSTWIRADGGVTVTPS